MICDKCGKEIDDKAPFAEQTFKRKSDDSVIKKVFYCWECYNSGAVSMEMKK